MQDRHIFYTVETPGMGALIETSSHRRTSLLAVEEFKLLAKAMSQLGAYASLLTDQTISVESIVTAVLGQQEVVEQLRARLTASSALRPYVAFATGEGIDQGGVYMALALVHADTEAAKENVALLRQRINETSSLLTGQPWIELIDHIEINSDGRVLLAKLHGRIARTWTASVFNRDSLFVHEGAAPAD